MNLNQLDRLCAAYGVQPEYYNIWGQHHPTSETTKRAILGAMDIAADTDEAVAASLHNFERRTWSRILPPVLVVRESSRPFQIAMNLPTGEGGNTYHWRLFRENGQTEEGAFTPDALEETGRHPVDGVEFVRRMLPLDLPLEPGYHRFSVERGEGTRAEMPLIVTPETCYLPPAVQEHRRVWGFAAQLYGVRSQRNWGMGDFGDLRTMLEFCAESGASTVLLNPLHALFPDAPEHASPYSPSSRVWFNTLYLDIEAIADFEENEDTQKRVLAPEFKALLAALRDSAQVNYQGIADLKLSVLSELYEHFRIHHLARDTERARDFRTFQTAHGDSLRELAVFEALQEHFREQDEDIWGWPVWPEVYRDRYSAEVAMFSETHLERIEFFEYLQWQACLQLEAAGKRSLECGLGIGIMLDLAIGVAEGGASTWTRRDLYALGASTGAPPDEINLMGQDWGLPPWIPHKLTEAAYEPFIELLRTNMGFAGALRMDHVMGLRRLFWVVRGLPAAEGAYVNYPFEDLLGILALESQRNRCLVVGEDLGTVPDEVRHALQPMGVFSTRLLYFERWDDGSMKQPHAYPEQAAAAVTTHDLPPLAGYWKGHDLELRDALKLFPSDEVRDRQWRGRSEDRFRLLAALEKEGLLPPGHSPSPESFPDMTPELAQAVYAYLARSASRLLLVQMEDGLGVAEQPNLPGTTEAVYPCWRLKLPLNIEEWRNCVFMGSIVQSLRMVRS